MIVVRMLGASIGRGPKRPVKKPSKALPEPHPRDLPKESIGELLAASMRAHLAAKDARRGRDAARAVASLLEAYTLRLKASDADPNRKDPAWEDDQTFSPMGRETHDDMMRFYREKLGL